MKRVVQVLAGLLVGLGLVEAAFYARAGGAFPHVNCYLPDAELGVRLEPGATQRISFSGNPVTSVRINQAGLRGADLPPPADGEIIVVGDSQVFGLGVEEDETFSARLAAETGRPVVNAGVPTYGPPEYAALARRLAAERKPETVVFTVNFVNDLFEWDAPNAQRHAEWDGWAVRTETAPESVVDYPGRRWVMRESHAVFALRAFWAGQQPDPEGAVGFPSEGTWTDLVDPSAMARAAVAGQPGGPTEADVVALEQELEAVQTALSEAVNAGRVEDLGWRGEDAGLLIQAAAGHPGDIVGPRFAEEARVVAVTARLMRRGVKYRQQVIDHLAERESEHVAAMQAALEQDATLHAQRQQTAQQVFNRRWDKSVLTPTLRKLRDDLEAMGVELVVVALPIDVQVSDEEWKKYDDAEPVDMAPSLVLIDDLVGDVEALGVRAVDTLPALKAAEPGAFLYGDIHMTPKGHAAVATALAASLEAKAPERLPDSGLEGGRTWVPRHEDWLRTPEAVVKGSTRARCETVRIAEWLRVTCLAVDGRSPTDVSRVTGDRGEARITRSKDAVTLVAPLFAGEPFAATFHWSTYGQVLKGTWSTDGTVELAFDDRDPSLRSARMVSEPEARLCGCGVAVRGEETCQLNGEPLDPTHDGFRSSWVHGCEDSCAQLSGGNLAACHATYPTDCAAFLACAEGRLSALATCPDGQAAVGGAGVCKPLCATDEDCTDSRACRTWQGAGYCE